MYKKLIFTVIALSVAVLTASCTVNFDKSSEQEYTDVSIGFWNIDNISYSGNSDSLLNYIQDKFDISITPVSVSWTDYKEYYQMLNATKSLPDVFATLTISSNDSNDSAYYESLIDSGSIRALPDDLSDYPNINRLLSETGYTRYKDGHFYVIPRLSFSDKSLSCTDAALIVRRDWMDKLGIDDPENIDELIDMFTAFCCDDPDGNGVDDTEGYNVNALSALGKWVILGIAPECNTYSWIEYNGRYIPSWYSPDFINVIKIFHQMYHCGALDKDFYIKNTNEVLHDFASGHLGALEYKSSPSSLKKLQDEWEKYNSASFDECVDVLHIFPAPDGLSYCNSSNIFWSESFISSSVSDEKMAKILKLYDFLLSDEGTLLSQYGFKDVDYTIENGNIRLLADPKEETLNSFLLKKYPSLALFSNLASWSGCSRNDFELTDINFKQYGKHCVELGCKDLNWNLENCISIERPEDFLIFPKEPSEEFSTANAFNSFLKCIIDSADPQKAWTAVIEKYKQDGLEDYINAQNTAFKKLQ